MTKKSNLFVFRRYNKKEGSLSKKVRHPKLIVDDYKNNYGFMGLTESSKKGHHSNIPIQNPKKFDKSKSYIRKEIRYDNKNNFGDVLSNYNLSKKDKKYLIDYVNKHKKR